MRKFLLLSVLIIILVFSLQLSLYAEDSAGKIEEVEINEYQGEKLGAIEDFRENSIKGIQEIDIDEYRLLIDGLVAEDQKYSYSELQEKNHIKKVVTLNCVTGWSVKALWEGIPLMNLLDELDLDQSANTLIFYSPDGYSTSLPISFIRENNIILADRLNGIQLPPRQGFPFQLVAEQKYGYKWIRWIERIEVSNDSDYEGYWESRGYSNSAEIN
jgi:DMSO/TMAO reductase YedYZ molybdopterin-dependent catalytic subunit